MRVLVTGGAGFIGSHVVDALAGRGHEVFVIDDLSSGRRENLADDVTLFEADIRDRDAIETIFKDVRPGGLSHQAAQVSVSRSVVEPLLDARINVVGWLNVLDAAVGVGVERIVFASSGGALYGDVSEPADEDHPAAPQSPYGISKSFGEQYLEFYARRDSITGVALRYSNVYGPRQNPHGEAGVVAVFCTRMLDGRPVTINGDGRYVRDYVYAADVAAANALAIEAELSEPFISLNIGTGVGIDVNDLESRLRTRCQARGLADPIPGPEHGEPRAGDLRSSIISATRAADRLGWQPAVTLDDGLDRTVEWFAGQ